MSLPLEAVVKQLEDSGIVSAGKLEHFVPPKAQPKDADELISTLVKENHLTKFQAAQIAAGRAKSLVVGGYTILDKIGAGGMGQVFKALHRRMDRLVAIKMLPSAMTKDAAAVARFEREVRAAAKLNHSNIVTAYDADQAGGVHFLVMEFVDGQDLSALVKKNGPFPVAKAVNYVLQAARGLEFAHGEGVVHRDIKPANLLLDKKGTVKILDMGLARIESQGDVAAQAELTGTGAVMGTVDYMAPEQAISTKNADARADIYSLGCSLYYLVAGKPTYTGETITAKLIAHQSHPIPELRAVCPEASADLEAVFRKMLAKQIGDRYQTIADVIADLEPLAGVGSQEPGIRKASSGVELGQFTIQTAGPTAAKAPATGTSVAKPPAKSSAAHDGNRRLIAMMAGGTLLCAGLVAALIFMLQNEPQEPPAAPVTAVAPPPSGPVNYALKFNGQSYVATPIRFDGSHPLTLEAYVTASAPETAQELIGDADGANGLDLRIENGNWAFRVMVKGGARSLAKTKIAPNQPTHVAGVWDGKTATLYVDGVAQPSQPAPTFSPTKMPLMIGANPDTPIERPPYFINTKMYFHGTIDEVRISKSARYQRDFKPQPRFTPDADTLALYHFDENSGTVAHDASTIGNHATIYGAKWTRGIAVQSGTDAAGPSRPMASFFPTSSPPPSFLTSSTTPYVPWPFDPRDGREYEWSKPENLGPIVNCEGTDADPALTPDQLTLITFQFLKGQGLREFVRASVTAPWQAKGVFIAKGDIENEGGGWISADGLTLLGVGKGAFGKERHGGSDIWMHTRASRDADWGRPVNLGAVVNSPDGNGRPALSPDGLALVFHSRRADGFGGSDLYVSRRPKRDAPWGPPQNLGPKINTDKGEDNPRFLADGKGLMFTRNGTIVLAQSDNQGNYEFSPLPSDGAIQYSKPWLSPDGLTLYFNNKTLPGGLGGDDIWVTRRVPKTPVPSTATPALRWPLTPSKPEDIKFFVELGATLTLRDGPALDRTVKQGDVFLTTPATIVGLKLYNLGGDKIDDDVLRRIGSLADLEELDIRPASVPERVTESGPRQLEGLVQLRELRFGPLGPQQQLPATFLTKLQRLEVLQPASRSGIEWAPYAAQVPTLREIKVYRSPLSDEELLTHLVKLPRLTKLELEECGTSLDAVKQFAAKLPWCRITTRKNPGNDGPATIEPTAPPPGTPVANATGSPQVRWPLAPSKPEDIAWLHDELKVTLTLRSGPDAGRYVQAGKALPTEPATIVGVEFGRDGSAVTDEVLKRIATLVDLEALVCNFGSSPPCPVTKDGLPQLAAIVNLRRLNLGRIGPKETDPAFLERFVNLELLFLGTTAFPGWEPHVGRLPALADMRLDKMDNAKLEQLGPMPRLTELTLGGYGTAEGSKRLDAAKQFAPLVPWCRIIVQSQDGKDKPIVIEPTAPPPTSAQPTVLAAPASGTK